MIREGTDDSGLLLYCAFRPVAAGDLDLPDGTEVIRGDRLSLLARAVDAIESLQEPSRADLMAFQESVQKVFEQTTVVPFRFGSIARSRDDVEEMLRSDAALWLDQLDRLDGRVEMGLRLWLPRPEPAQTAPDKPRTGADYLRARKAKYAAEQPYDQRHPVIANILETARGTYSEYDISYSEKSTELFGETTVSVAFLIPRGTQDSFFETLASAPAFDAIDRSEVTGPWPPYSFVGNR